MLVDRKWNKRLTIAFAIIVFAVLIGIVFYRQFLSGDILYVDLDKNMGAEIQTWTAAPQPRHGLSTVVIECVDFADKSYTENVTVQCRQHSIEITVFSVDTLCIKFDQQLPNFVLMWFNDTVTNTIQDYEMSADDISCIVLLQQVVYITELTIDTTYTFCLFENTSTTVSPFDCVAYYLRPINDSDSSSVWISKDDQYPVILTGVEAFAIFVWLGIILGMLLIRWYPNGLKGATNVKIVDSGVNLKVNGSLHSISNEFSIEDSNSVAYRCSMERRCFSTSNIMDYEIALNPSRFDIIKSRLEASQYEEKYYLEDVPKIAPPEPPKYDSPVPTDKTDNIL